MRYFTFFSRIIALILGIVFSVGCSSGGQNPIVPQNGEKFVDDSTPALKNDPTSHSLLGYWTADFNIAKSSCLVQPERFLNTHFNVTERIPSPVIHVNSWDPVEQILDVDVLLHNPYFVDVYDVRLIVFTDDADHTLLNPDNWTNLYDIPPGYDVNPFKAYAKSVPNREFSGMSFHTENLKIKCPNGNYSVSFAVDASLPGNCDEPYEIRNFRQTTLFSSTGSGAWIYIDVLDWQNDGSEVKLNCMSITGTNDLPLIHTTGNMWKVRIFNTRGAPSGDYPAIISAFSSGSGDLALFDLEEIRVIDESSGIPQNPELASIIGTDSYFDNLKTDGDYAYFSYAGSIKIADMSDIYSPSIIGYVNLDPQDYSVYPHGKYLFCNAFNILTILDISNIQKPEVIYEGLNYWYKGDIRFSGRYAFFITDTTISAFDISDPRSPQMEDQIEFPDYLGDPKLIQGNYIYLSYSIDYQWSIKVIDISDPSDLHVVGTCEIGERIYDIAQRDGYIYVSVASTSIVILDAHDLSNIYEVNAINYQSSLIYNFRLIGDYLYCFGTLDTFTVYDISDPMNPIKTGTLELDFFWEFHNSSFSGNVACLWSQQTVATVDISDPYNPHIAGYLFNGYLSDFDIKGDYLYTAYTGLEDTPDPNPGLRIYDISDPYRPAVSSYFLSGPGRCYSITTNGNRAYVVDKENFDSQLDIIDISDPANPQRTATLNKFGEGSRSLAYEDYSVYSAGNYFEASTDQRGVFQRADVSDPTNPHFSGIIDPLLSRFVSTYEDYAFVLGDNKNLYLVNIGDPNEIRIEKTIYEKISCFIISDQYFYCCFKDTNTGISYFKIYDISDLYSPVELGSMSGFKEVSSIDVSGNYAYLVDNLNNSIQIVDISDNSSPTLFNVYESEVLGFGAFAKIKVQNNLAFLSSYNRGMFIVKLW